MTIRQTTVVTAFVVLLPFVVRAQPASPQAENNVVVLKQTSAQAKAYQIGFTSGRETDSIQLVPQPILRWSNPELGEVYGNIFLWTSGGRPVVAGSMHRWITPRTDSTHEFQLLTERTVVARGERGEWRPRKSDVRFQSLNDASAPAKSASLRLLQMRQIARQFEAGKVDREEQKSKLRLLVNPVYRYELEDAGSEKDDIIDGGLFAFVESNDPEVWLMIEARQTNAGPEWVFAIARMNSTFLRVHHSDTEVWSVNELPWSTVFNTSQPFALLNRPN